MIYGPVRRDGWTTARAGIVAPGPACTPKVVRQRSVEEVVTEGKETAGNALDVLYASKGICHYLKFLVTWVLFGVSMPFFSPNIHSTTTMKSNN